MKFFTCCLAAFFVGLVIGTFLVDSASASPACMYVICNIYIIDQKNKLTVGSVELYSENDRRSVPMGVLRCPFRSYSS